LLKIAVKVMTTVITMMVRIILSQVFQLQLNIHFINRIGAYSNVLQQFSIPIEMIGWTVGTGKIKFYFRINIKLNHILVVKFLLKISLFHENEATNTPKFHLHLHKSLEDQLLSFPFPLDYISLSIVHQKLH
jgi:hypothetical protein